jgi:hypothetical protein
MAGEPYLNARQAAAYVGYEPGVDGEGQPLPTADDKAMRAFYQFVRRHKVETKRAGRRLLFRKSSLDRAIERSTEAYADARSPMERMEELARKHARGEARAH